EGFHDTLSLINLIDAPWARWFGLSSGSPTRWVVAFLYTARSKSVRGAIQFSRFASNYQVALILAISFSTRWISSSVTVGGWMTTIERSVSTLIGSICFTSRNASDLIITPHLISSIRKIGRFRRLSAVMFH